MLRIAPLQPKQTEQARRTIYSVAYSMSHDRDTLEETIAFFQEVWPLEDIDHFQEAYLENGGAFLVILDGEQVVGTGALRKLEDQVGEIKRLWLLPEYQGQGVGYQMMQQLFAIAREKGYTQIRLQTNPEYNQRAYVFYRRLGFYEIPTYYEDPEEPGEVGMELTL